jgi:host factor-I protein
MDFQSNRTQARLRGKPQIQIPPWKAVCLRDYYNCKIPIDRGFEFITLEGMAPPTSGRRRQKTPPPGETGQEILYLRFLSEKQVPVTVKLRDGESVYGWIEYFDDRMIRLTREGKPNLFIYKNQIRTITESVRHIEARRRERNRSNSTEHLPVEVSIPTPSVLPMALDPGLPQNAMNSSDDSIVHGGNLAEESSS